MTRVENEFKKYTDPYRGYGDKILLKIDHSLRVKDLCVDIAKSLNLNDKDIEFAAICGLIHDIGRFEQWKRYQTYNDQRSVDHGDLGAEILEGMNGAFRESGQEMLLDTVRYHNKYRVPDTVDEKSRLFVNITRDADKLDILDLFVTGGLVKQTGNTAISNRVYGLLLEKTPLRKEDIETKADAIGGYLAFVFDFNYKRSFEIAQEKDFINRLIDLQKAETENEEFIRQLEELRTIVTGYMQDRTADGLQEAH